MDLIGEGPYSESDGARLFQLPRSRCMVSARRPSLQLSTNPSLNDTSVAEKSRSPSPMPEKRRSRSRSRDHDRDRRRDQRSRSRSYSPRRGSRYSRSPRRSYGRYRRSPSPRDRRSPRGHATDEDEVTDTFIRTVAAEVKGHGQKYEESLKEMEKENPRYAFLTDRNVSASHTSIVRVA
jgi:U2-associated protein SR140